MIKIDTDFNFNVLLKLCFSLSKKIIFFSPILANNNIPLKIYCENIVIIFHSSFFLFFSPLFLSSTHGISFFLFSFFFSLFFSPPHTYTFSFLSYPSFLLFFIPTIPPNSRTFRALLLRLFFFFFLALRLLVLGGVVDVGLWERGPLLGKEAFGFVFLAKPISKFLKRQQLWEKESLPCYPGCCERSCF